MAGCVLYDPRTVPAALSSLLHAYLQGKRTAHAGMHAHNNDESACKGHRKSARRAGRQDAGGEMHLLGANCWFQHPPFQYQYRLFCA
eukprot:739358-Pelagomonas_calceolata.AAC.6